MARDLYCRYAVALSSILIAHKRLIAPFVSTCATIETVRENDLGMSSGSYTADIPR